MMKILNKLDIGGVYFDIVKAAEGQICTAPDVRLRCQSSIQREKTAGKHQTLLRPMHLVPFSLFLLFFLFHGLFNIFIYFFFYFWYIIFSFISLILLLPLIIPLSLSSFLLLVMVLFLCSLLSVHY